MRLLIPRRYTSQPKTKYARLADERGTSPNQCRALRKRKAKARRRRKIRRATQQAMRR